MLIAPLNLDLLKEVLAVPTHYSDTSAMTHYLLNYGSRHGWSTSTDKWGNVFFDKGTAAIKPLVVAHIDTVHPVKDLLVHEHAGRLFATDTAGELTGIGGDNKTGVYTCLHLMHGAENLKAAFFTGEEIGGIGARNADADWFDDVGWCMEFDAPGSGIFAYSSGGVQLFKDEGKAIKRIERVLQFHRLTRWQHHPGTDVMVLKQRFGFTCFNLPSGYYNFHTDNEFVYIGEVGTAWEAGEDIIGALGCASYPFTAPKVCTESKHHMVTPYSGSTPPDHEDHHLG